MLDARCTETELYRLLDAAEAAKIGPRNLWPDITDEYDVALIRESNPRRIAALVREVMSVRGLRSAENKEATPMTDRQVDINATKEVMPDEREQTLQPERASAGVHVTPARCVCRMCGRVGQRGFIPDDRGHDVLFFCSNRGACERRQAIDERRDD